MFSLKKSLFLLLCATSLASGIGEKDTKTIAVGFGFTLDPAAPLLTFQYDYNERRGVSWGELLQIAPGGTATYGTLSWVARFDIGNEPRFQPFVEAGLGIAYLANRIGAHLVLGGGIDYIVDRNFAVGSALRLNLAPPADLFFISWPIIYGRVVL